MTTRGMNSLIKSNVGSLIDVMMMLGVLLLLSCGCHCSCRGGGVHGFLLSTIPTKSARIKYKNQPKQTVLLFNNKQEENESLKKEIEDMKAEALRRLETLQSNVNGGGVPPKVNNNNNNNNIEKESDIVMGSLDNNGIDQQKPQQQQQQPQDTTETLISTTKPNTMMADEDYLDDMTATTSAMLSNNNKNDDTNDRRASNALLQEIKRQRAELDLLEGTSWKVVMNVGRQPNTWMPQEWGASGDRLTLTMEVEFCKDSLYLTQAKEEFFGFPMSIGRLLKVKNDGWATLGPTATCNAKQVRVRSGGWKVCPKEGPAETTLLKWYVEVLSNGDGDIEWNADNELSKVGHRGSDVYIPTGRVYGTCGYFPTTKTSSSKKKMITQQREEMIQRYESLQMKMEQDTSFLSWDKVKNIQKKQKLESQIETLNQQLNLAMIQEPDTSILRSSQDGNVSLTKEGGLCCKVKKGGGAIEYHILGTFGLAAIRSKKNNNDS